MKQTVFAVITVASLFLGATSCSQQPSAKDQTTVPAEFTISKEKLMDKIKGGWAGQTIGCTYGGPTEFKYNGTMIQEYVPIAWPDLGCEAVRRLTVQDMPLTVVLDAHGGDLYEEGPAAYLAAL